MVPEPGMGANNDHGAGSTGGADRPDDNDRGGSREDKESFDRAMDNAERPDRAPAGPSEAATADENDDDKRSATDNDDRPDRAAGPPGIGAPPSSPSPSNVDEENEDSGQRHANEFDGIGPSGAPTSQTDATDIVGVAGYAAAGGYAGIDGARRGRDYAARAAAAETLTRGNAGNLPVPGSEYANRAELAKDIKDTRITVDDARGKTPYGPDAQSTRQLNVATRTTSALNAAAKTVGLGLQPAAGALEGYRNTPEDAGIAQTGLNMARAAVKEADDTLVSYGFGGFAASGVVAISPAAGPAAPAVAIGGAPAAGMAAGIGAGAAYNDSLPDRAFDKGVDVVFDGIESVVDTVGGAFGYVGDQIDQWEAGIIEQAVRRTASKAND